MEIIDVSVPIHAAMPVWPDDPAPLLTPLSSTAAGDHANVSLLAICTHTGTHVDAPYHFLQEGARLDQVPLDRLVGPAVVVEIEGEGDITADQLEAARAAGALPRDAARVLLKTRNTARGLMRDTVFHTDYVAVAPDAAEWLVASGVVTVGIDYLSVERFRPPEPRTHRTLLGAGVLVIEGLDLREAPSGPCTLVCGVPSVEGADGAPARVVLLPPFPAG